MHTACQALVEVLGDMLALMTRRQRGVWSLPDRAQDILASGYGRYKARPHINHSLSKGELGVRGRSNAW
jgi:hypothetical protein